MNTFIIAILVLGLFIGYMLLEVSGVFVLGKATGYLEKKFTRKQRFVVSLVFVFVCFAVTLWIVARHYSALAR